MENSVDILSAILKKKELTLSIAESCTGGMITAAITDRAGSSSFFDRGFITYSNQAKIEMLSVPEDLIKTYGAVSIECAESMAMGALKNSSADIAVSVTGIAGPGGCSEEKPVGLVYIGIATLSHHSFVKEYNFSGNRASVREQAAKTALSLLIDAAGAI